LKNSIGGFHQSQALQPIRGQHLWKTLFHNNLKLQVILFAFTVLTLYGFYSNFGKFIKL